MVLLFAVHHAEDPDTDEDEVVAPDVHNHPLRYRGHHLDPLNKPHPEDHLEPWTKRIYNVDYACCYKIKDNFPKDVRLPILPLPIACDQL